MPFASWAARVRSPFTAPRVDKALDVALRPVDGAVDLAQDSKPRSFDRSCGVGDGGEPGRLVADHSAPSRDRFTASFELRFYQGDKLAAGRQEASDRAEELFDAD